MTTTHVLQTHHLKKYFGATHAVEDISLSIKHGEIFGFLGPNGAGKTTTISMILGLMYPTAGESALSAVQPLKTANNQYYQQWCKPAVGLILRLNVGNRPVATGTPPGFPPRLLNWLEK